MNAELIRSGTIVPVAKKIEVKSKPAFVCHVKCEKSFLKSNGRLFHKRNAFFLVENEDWKYKEGRVIIRRPFKNGFYVLTNKLQTIKSLYFDQQDILFSILKLNNLPTFDLDFTYGNGQFYREIDPPSYRFDIDRNLANVKYADSRNVPLNSCSIKSCMFDPPFLTYVKQARSHADGKMVMSSRFGGYWSYKELEDHYRGTILEAARILKKGGILVIKCQDIIHNHKMCSTHINVVNWAQDHFRLKDYFILGAKARMTRTGRQNHARSFHSYFLVLEKLGKSSFK